MLSFNVSAKWKVSERMSGLFSSNVIAVTHHHVIIFLYTGKVIIHALDEKARAYYDLDSLWTSDPPQKESKQVMPYGIGNSHLEPG